MHEDLTQAVESGILTQNLAETLDSLAPGAFCQHKSWGFGRVASWDTVADKIVIDFSGKSGHVMQLAYAASTLQPIPDRHILARRVTEPDVIRELASSAPVELFESILKDHGGKATTDQITAALTPAVFTAPAFKKWFESTKKAIKADGRFVIPAKKSEPFVLLDEPVSPGRGLLEKFRGARFLKDQVAALDQITKALDDLAQEVEELKVLASQIEDAAQKGRKLQVAQAVELLLARDEILSRHDALQPGSSAPSVAGILRDEGNRMQELFAALPATKQRKVLEHFPAAFGEDYIENVLSLAKEAPARLVVEVAKFLEKQGQTESLRVALNKWISSRTVSTETLIWLCKERGAAFPELFNADLLNAIFSGLERDLLNEKRGSRLQDLLLSDQKLLADILKNAGADAVRDAMRRLILTPVFADLDKRSLIGRIIKLYPEMQSMIGGDSEAADHSLTVSWPSLEARKAAYEHLVNYEIPQNVRDIAVAREQGDLRENFGFKAAKEQQRVLARRRAELERDLAIARGTDFESPDTTQVSIGTVISLDIGDGQQETYSILGAWDSVPDEGIVSYKAAIGQTLMGKKVGDTVELASESGARKATITAIAPFTRHELLKKIHEDAMAVKAAAVAARQDSGPSTE
ncbi:MAG: transcription elongation factor GreA [Terrimicrobiaceae bacterium]